MTTLPGLATTTSPSKKAQHHQTRTLTCNTATGATVAQLPEPVPELSHTYRSQHVHYEPGQHSRSVGVNRVYFDDLAEPRRYVTSLSWTFFAAPTGFEPVPPP